MDFQTCEKKRHAGHGHAYRGVRGIGGFPVSGEAFGAMIGAASVYDMANQFDLYDNGGLDICFMGGLEVDSQGNVNAHRGPGAFAGIGGFANITAKTPSVVFCLTFNTKGLEVSQKKGVVTIHKEGTIPKFVDKVSSISFSQNGHCKRPEGAVCNGTLRFPADAEGTGS